jgi:hypothetical protein
MVGTQAGAPLDNSIAERALKKAILHRRNLLLYKTENGARVGDLFMSLIHTCELSAANPSTTSPSCSSMRTNCSATLRSGCRGTTEPHWKQPAPASTPARVE